MSDHRLQYLINTITRVDGQKPSPRLSKHQKMATSPFVFYRGSAQLFYADIEDGAIINARRLLLTYDHFASSIGHRVLRFRHDHAN